MRTLEVGQTKVGNQAVLVAPDAQGKAFRGVNARQSYDYEGSDQPKGGLISPWVRLTGPKINEAPVDEILDGAILDEWLPPSERAGKLAVVEGVVVAFPTRSVSSVYWPPEPSLRLRGWRFMPGPMDTALREVVAPVESPNGHTPLNGRMN